MLYLLYVLEKKLLNISQTVSYAFLEKKQAYAHEFTTHACNSQKHQLTEFKMLQRQVKRQVHR